MLLFGQKQEKLTLTLPNWPALVKMRKQPLVLRAIEGRSGEEGKNWKCLKEAAGEEAGENIIIEENLQFLIF